MVNSVLPVPKQPFINVARVIGGDLVGMSTTLEAIAAREAGIAEGFSFVFRNRGIPQPYEPLGIWLIDQWRQIGLKVNHVVQETGSHADDVQFHVRKDVGDLQRMDEVRLARMTYLSLMLQGGEDVGPPQELAFLCSRHRRRSSCSC